MIAQQMGDHIRDQIMHYVSDVFVTLGYSMDKENIWHDFAEIRPGYLKSTFYIKNIDNVVRKDFNALSEQIQKQYPEVKCFKVKFKRPDKEVRFFLEVNKAQSEVLHD